jgi:hypothetical protein
LGQQTATATAGGYGQLNNTNAYSTGKPPQPPQQQPQPRSSSVAVATGAPASTQTTTTTIFEDETMQLIKNVVLYRVDLLRNTSVILLSIFACCVLPFIIAAIAIGTAANNILTDIFMFNY